MPVRVRLRAQVSFGRWLRRLLLIVALIGFGGLLSFRIFLSSERGSRWIRFLAVQILSDALRTDVRIGSLHLSGIATLEIQNLSVDDLQCEPFLKVPELRISWRPGLFWQGFWKGKLLIPLSTVEIEQPFFYLYHERASGLLNLDRLFPPDTTPSPPSKTSFSLRIPQLTIHNATFLFRDSTASDSALQVRKGFMNYANLHLSKLYLSASIEKHRERLFLYIRHLSVTDTAAGVRVDTLRLVGRAYPDSTVIDNLFLRTGASRLKGQGKFLYEGLDKLFVDTDTKQFVAGLAGEIDWQDISALSGESLPLRGLWHIETELMGDLLRFRWKQLFIETREGIELETAGEIWHYARPKSLYWDVQLRQGKVSLGALRATLPEASGWPEDWDTLRFWLVKGRSIGSLYSYWFQMQLPRAQVLYTMEKNHSVWHWYADAKLSGWSVADLIPDWPIREVYGGVRMRGEGFDWRRWTGTLEAELSGLYDTIRIRQLSLSAEAAGGQWSGALTLSGSDLLATARGSVRLAESPLFNLSGAIQTPCWWGPKGKVAAGFQANLTAPAWNRLHGTVLLTDLIWQKPDTLLSLGTLKVEIAEGDPINILLTSEGIQGQALISGDWNRLITQVEGITTAAQRWAIEKACPALPDSVRIAPFEVGLNLHEKGAWVWLHLMGVPEAFSGGLAQASLAWNPDGWRVQMEIDSLILPFGDLHGIKLRAEGQWQACWPFMASIHVDYGEQYLLFRELAVEVRGAYPEGLFRVTSDIGFQDTMHFQGHWQWHGGGDFGLRLQAAASTFTLAGQPWRFSDDPYVSYSDTTWQWYLVAESKQARLSTKNTSDGMRTEGQGIPIRPLILLFGEDWPVEGLLSLSWTQDPTPSLSLQLKNLSYQGQSYPDLQLFTQTHPDTLPIRLAWGNGTEHNLTAIGYYVLTDTTAPLFLRFSGDVPAVWLSPFINDYLEGVGGTFRLPRLIVKGSLSNPKLVGDILLDRVRAYVPFLRLSYMAEGVIKCREDTIWVPSLPLSDFNQRYSLLDGYIALRSWLSPYLALSLRVKEGPLRVLSTRPSSDAYFYGQALIEQGELRFTGPWNSVQVQGSLRFAEGTELTLPVENYLRTEKRSYVRFVGHQDTLAPIIQAPEGLYLRVSLLSAPGARFRVLFDSRTGDEILAAGTSNLFLRITPEGQVTISGSYEVTTGEYRFSLRGIVARTLRIESGSRITWDGDLYQGRLQITATYRTFTSLRMVDSTYTATVPVEVRLLLGGILLSPELRFQVDIPNLTGNPSPLVTLFLQRLQNDEQERNRQVFALLALGTFLPPEQGIAAAQTTSGVSNTLSEFISAQLSSLVGQIVGSQLGIGFSMGQWNEVSTQVRLSLGGRLTIQREGVLVGPGQTNPTLGNLSVRYRILPPRITSPTQIQLEAEAFNRQTFFGGSFGGSTQGMGISTRKSFFLPPRRKRQTP